MIEYKSKLTVSKPDLPDFDEYVELLRDIWDRKHVTNFGKLHRQFENALRRYLRCENISLFCNGSIALQTGLQALDICGEVITTPFTFPASTHAIHWNRCGPVFCDIDPETFCLDPERLEPLITSKTSAILPVHVYGRPCAVHEIAAIAAAHNLEVFYDAAHAFGVTLANGESILEHGTLSMLSFHATKVFNSVEGGALVTDDAGLKQRIDYLLNFGIKDEVTIVGPGSNGKMNELIAAYGLLVLKRIDEAIEARGRVDARYRQNLPDIPGITVPPLDRVIRNNYSYFPVLVEREYGPGRDELFRKLMERDILARPYFYPLTSNIPHYRDIPSASRSNLPVANAISEKVLCLPIYSSLRLVDVDHVCEVIEDLRGA